MRPVVVPEALRERLGWEREQMAAFLAYSSRAYARRVWTEQFELGQRLKLEMLALLLERATEVLRGEEEASGRLCAPTVSLDLQPPIDHVSSIYDHEHVREALGKIEYGVS